MEDNEPFIPIILLLGGAVCGKCHRSSQWRLNGRDSVSNHQPHDCFLSHLFRHRSKKTSKLRVTGLCVGNSPGTGEFPHKWPVTRKMFPFDDVITTLMLQERNQRNNVIELINFSHFLLVALLCENICMQAYKIHQRLIHSHIIFFLWIMLLKRFCQFLCSLRLSTVPNNMLNKTTHCRHDDVERSTHIRITMWPWKIMFHERLLQRSLGNT